MGSVPRWYTFRSHYWYIIPCPSIMAEGAQKPALVLEEDAQHLGDREDYLTMGNIHKEFFPQRGLPQSKHFSTTSRMTGRKKP